MSIDITELRRLHAATVQGVWEVIPLPRMDIAASFVINGVIVSKLLQPDMVWTATAHNVFPALLDEIEGLTDENRMLINQAERFAKMLTEARANDRCAMEYLAKCKQAAGYEGDYPGLIKEIERLRAENRCLRDAVNEMQHGGDCNAGWAARDPEEQV